jgi:hypothetical protein
MFFLFYKIVRKISISNSQFQNIAFLTNDENKNFLARQLETVENINNYSLF